MAVADLLDQYLSMFEIESTEALRNSLRFHEHLFNHEDRGVFETGCGFGKSTWALCRIATKASAGEPYIYIVETLDAVRKAGGVLQRLNSDLNAGIYHGFDREQCRGLTGQEYNWRQTIRGDDCVCNTCAHQDECTFYSRDQALRQHAVVMTHQGFLILAEQDRIRPESTVIIDEDLQTMLSADFTLKQLLDIDRYACEMTGNQYRNLSALLPGTLMERYVEDEVRDYDPALNHSTYCNQHYALFSPDTQTAERGLGDIAMAISMSGGSVPEHVWSFYFFFRSARDMETDFVLHETQDQGGMPRLHLKKNRIGLGDVNVRKLWVLNASATLSPGIYPESMGIHRCLDLQPNSHRIGLYVLEANPMRSKAEENLEATRALLEAHPELQSHTQVLLALSKKDGDGENAIGEIKPFLDESADIKVINRGRLKGTNEASDRTLVILSCMSVFTTVDNCAMTLALQTRRTIPISTICNEQGRPLMHRGYFAVPDIQEIYACSALDELYQALYRSAIRRDQEVDVIIAVPHIEWLSALQRTVLPGFSLEAAYRYKEGVLKEKPLISGFCELLGMDTGECIRKCDAAETLGYNGSSAWKDNRERIRFWLDPFFEEQHRTLVRKP